MLLEEIRRLLTGSSAAPWRPLLAERVHVRVCNRAVAIGVEQAMAELSFLFSRVELVGSKILDVWSISPGVVVDTDLMRRLISPENLPVPCAVIIEPDRVGRLLDIRFYFDPTSVL